MRLYDSEFSGNCYKVRLLLSHLGLAYERQEVDVFDHGNRLELLGDKNPSCRVPVLELDDGRTLGESNAIMCYLAEGTQYLPGDPFQRAQVLQWLFFEQNIHEPTIAVVRHWKAQGKEADHAAEHLQARLELGRYALQAMERHLRTREFLAGERYSIADIALYAYTHVAPEGGFSLDDTPSVRAWLQRVREQRDHVPMSA